VVLETETYGYTQVLGVGKPLNGGQSEVEWMGGWKN